MTKEEIDKIILRQNALALQTPYLTTIPAPSESFIRATKGKSVAENTETNAEVADKTLSATTPPISTPSESSDTKSMAEEYISALNTLKTKADNAREAYEGLSDDYINRKPFEYSLNGDALYQQYRDQYMREGKLAMEDTLGKAAALTGGYGNSYAIAAGEQAYQGYIDRLNDVVPTLYDIAYSKYTDEGNALKNKASVAKQAYAEANETYNNALGSLLPTETEPEQPEKKEPSYNYSITSKIEEYAKSLAEDEATAEQVFDYLNQQMAYGYISEDDLLRILRQNFPELGE